MNYSVVIHTCDKYQDCWEPFFKCFDKYWTDSNCDVFIANEWLDINVPEDVYQIKTGRGEWSDRLLRALSVIPDQPVFYMLEDFWLNKEVDVRKYFELFKELDADSLRVVYTSPLLMLNHKYDNLYQIDSKSRYILSCQPSFWKKDYLRSTLVAGEDPWKFEVDGTKRMHMAGYKSKAYLAEEDWYVGSYHRGKINKEGEEYLEAMND